MSRRMWPYDAEVKLTVRATYKQVAAWGRAAGIKGLATPVFLAFAADEYSAHLERVWARFRRRSERKEARDKGG